MYLKCYVMNEKLQKMQDTSVMSKHVHLVCVYIEKHWKASAMWAAPEALKREREMPVRAGVWPDDP